MIKFSELFSGFLRDSSGSMAIETAVVAPILVLLSIGGFEASTMVARQSELQSAAAEATSIVLATIPETQEEIDDIADVVRASSGLDEESVTLSRVYRCGTATDMIANASSCTNTDLLSTYIRIVMTDSYTPQWTHFGFGSAV
jgi:Flp pilus assembly protein TadG